MAKTKRRRVDKRNCQATVLSRGHYEVWKHDSGLVEVVEALGGGFVYVRSKKSLADLRGVLASLARSK